ncbi:MAG: response regulator transcription factor [Lachnospiraceae bacterium]|nr:response regulator transcription factor [Lachnospiraceae bacterium]
METIGIIEDDELLNQALVIALKREGYRTLSAYTCREGLRFREDPPDLILIDINLPDGDGISLCRMIREYQDIPAIFLTGRDEEADMLGAYSAGADDYVVKPFPISVLIKRVQAVLYRCREHREEFLYLGLKICFAQKKVTLEGKPVALTPKEYRLLEFLAKNKGQILTKDQILEHVWDVDGIFVGENAVSVVVNRLRRKIEADASHPTFIKNIFGQGYQFGE